MGGLRTFGVGGVLFVLLNGCGTELHRVPAKHRAAAAVCDNERPAVPGSGTPTASSCETDSDCEALGGTCYPSCAAACVDSGQYKICVFRRGECVRNDDCTRGTNGRCESNRDNSFCTYDVCFNDSECSSGGPCVCGGRPGEKDANECLAGNCQTDADCGSGSYCSPSFGDCGNYSGVIAYYCHTPDDACIDDSECADRERGPGYCMYRPELGHWACGYGQCVG